MQKRSVVAVIVLTFLTLGIIYPIVWMVKIKDEMVARGADVPTAWWLLVPIGSIWWMWKWAGGVEHVTRGKLSQVITMILLLLLGVIGMAIIQAELNKVEGSVGQLPQARVA